MRARRSATAALFLAVGCCAVSGGAAGAAERPEAVPGEIVVGFRESAGPERRAAARDGVAARLERRLEVPGAQVLRVGAGRSVPAAVAELRRRPEVEYAHPNYVLHAHAIPNDPRFPSLWGLHNTAQAIRGVTGTADADIDAPEAWNIHKGSTATVVGVVDTGVDYDHVDLAGAIWTNSGEMGMDAVFRLKSSNGIDDDGNGKIDDWRGWDWVEKDNTPADMAGHGTHVAATIGARQGNATGMTGVAPNAKIAPLRVLDASGDGTIANIADAFFYAGRKGMRVVNASLGGTANLDQQNALRAAVERWPNTLYVVAAGNGGNDRIGDDNDRADFNEYPCELPSANLLCVAATDSKDALAGFSNYGRGTVDLAAPGVAIESAQPYLETQISENWETDFAGRWSAGGVNNSWQRAARDEENTVLVADPLFTAYLPGTDSYIQRETGGQNSIGQTDCVVEALLRTGTETNFDFLDIEFSDGFGLWQRVFSQSGIQDWRKVHIRMPTADNRNEFWLRYRFRTNADNNSLPVSQRNLEGIAVDDTLARCRRAGSTNYAFEDGTSMATPHVAGAAAVLFARFSTLADVRRRLLESVDKKTSLTSKVASGGRLNLHRALARSSVTVEPEGLLLFNGGTGVTNDTRITRVTDTTGTWWKVSDLRSYVDPGAGCVAVTPFTARCQSAGTTKITVNAGDGDDYVAITGGAGIPTTLSGGSGDDRLKGGDGDDTMRGGTGSDLLDGAAGRDTATYSERGVTKPVKVSLDGLWNDGEISLTERDNVSITTEVLVGGNGADELRGNEYPNTIYGGGGADLLFGLAGQDTLRADDDVADTTLDCGADGDHIVRDSIDPAPVGCESSSLG